jgi:ribonuclease BN (tRNA processing enzyme)
MPYTGIQVMKLIFLGSGSAFTVGADNYHSNMLLINEAGSKLLIDCGSDVRHSLNEQGFTHKDITDVYISHLHADHSGGLEWLACEKKFGNSSSRPNLYINQSMVDSLWSKIGVGLGTVQGMVVDIDSYFNVIAIPNNGSFDWENIHFQLLQTVHAMNGYTLIPSYGLLFTINNKKIFITSDTQFSPNQILHFYEKADVIFQDCETAECRSGVHAHYSELVTLDKKIKSKMWLYHYNPGPLPDAKKGGFKGFIVKGQAFTF